MYQYEAKALDTPNATSSGKIGTGSDTGAFLLIGCVSEQKVCHFFDTSSQACKLINGIRRMVKH